ncbi:MAG: adenylyl-sulfate kinase, partial [Ginsengibacter sp.]
PKMKNIVCHDYQITRDARNRRNKHSSFVIWFTGLSGSGKSTIASSVEKELYNQNIQTYSLDGDNIRTGINKELGFSEEDRHENIRRIGEIAKLFTDAGTVVVAAFITPLEKDREMLRGILGKENLVEIFVNTSLAECERRDVKGLYKKARLGVIKNFTGISAPYENPEKPDIEIQTEKESIESAVKRIVNAVSEKLKI